MTSTIKSHEKSPIITQHNKNKRGVHIKIRLKSLALSDVIFMCNLWVGV